MKRLLAFIFVLSMVVALCACGHQSTSNQGVVSSDSQTSSNQSSSVPDYASLAEPKNGKEALSVLSCSVSYNSSGTYYYLDFTVRNDVDVTIKIVTINVTFLDKDGNIINTTHPQESARLRPGQSEVIEALCDVTLNPVECYVDSISYYDGEDNYHSFYLDNPEMFKMF